MLSHSVFNPVSPQGLAISNLFIFISYVSVVIILLIVGVLAYTLTHYRHRPGDPDPPQTFGWVPIEIVWTAIPFLLLVATFIATIYAMNASSPPNDNAINGRHVDMTIVGHQWWWEVRYANGVVTANEIHMPVGKRMLVAFQSVDVIHNFWAPQINGKVASVPGQTNLGWMEADKPGTYEADCAEYCGAAHARMRAIVIAQPQAQFNAWMRQQLAPPPPPTGLAAQGAKLYFSLSCQSCHSTDIGPDLTHVGSRTTLAADTITNTPANMEAWLHDPDAIKPGVHMPNFQLTNAEVRMLTAYLESQK